MRNGGKIAETRGDVAFTTLLAKAYGVRPPVRPPGIRSPPEGTHPGGSSCVRIPIGPILAVTFGMTKSCTAPPFTVLVLDDCRSVLQSIEVSLRDGDVRLLLCEHPEEALGIIEREPVDLAISDVRMPGIDGFTFLDRALELDPAIDVMLMTGYSTVEDAVACLQHGAVHYLPKPFRPGELRRTVREILQARAKDRPQDVGKLHEAVRNIVGRSPLIQEIIPLIGEFARYEMTVLVHGETGTGKELVARAIHDAGPRSDRPYVVCNCSAFSDTLLESEFFGHSRGAFTDADEPQAGLYEMAHGGVLFLDEIGDLPLVSQAKLLRAIESGEIQRVGETESRMFDVQVVAATNKDLAEEVRAGRFRKDLYYRLNVAQITLPPLRERRGDVPVLVERFLADAAAEYRKPVPSIDPEAMRVLMHYPWPGNVRELRNVIFRAMLFHGEGTLRRPELPAEVVDAGAALAASGETSMDSVRREHIRLVLDQLGGNKSDAARVLGVSRVTLYRELERYGLRS